MWNFICELKIKTLRKLTRRKYEEEFMQILLTSD